MTRFRDRAAAGRSLADRLEDLRDRDCVVLALPRGGVPVGYEIARRIDAPLDVLSVRKLGVPGHEELAFGAIASGGLWVLNREVVRAAGLSKDAIERVIERESRELERRERAYRTKERPSVAGRTAILVDDGIATGATMRAALSALATTAAAVIVAVPVAPPQVRPIFEAKAARYVVSEEPRDMRAIGLWYEDFSQTSDEEVRALLSKRG